MPDRKPESATPQSPVMYTAQQVADALGVCLSAVYYHAQQGHIPHFRVGRRVLFMLSEVRDAWPARAGSDADRLDGVGHRGVIQNA